MKVIQFIETVVCNTFNFEYHTQITQNSDTIIWSLDSIARSYTSFHYLLAKKPLKGFCVFSIFELLMRVFDSFIGDGDDIVKQSGNRKTCLNN